MRLAGWVGARGRAGAVQAFLVRAVCLQHEVMDQGDTRKPVSLEILYSPTHPPTRPGDIAVTQRAEAVGSVEFTLDGPTPDARDGWRK